MVPCGWVHHAAWSAADRHWYADLLLHCSGGSCAANEATAVLDRLNLQPWTRCLRLIGYQSEDCRYVDTAGQAWLDDRKGRWSAQMGEKKAWLHHRIAELQPNRLHADGDVGSHICGFCDCVRLEHIRYQPASEDILDRRHHAAHGQGSIRPEHHPMCDVPMSPTVETVQQKRVLKRKFR